VSEADCSSPSSAEANYLLDFTSLSVNICGGVLGHRDNITFILPISCSIFINFLELSLLHNLFLDASFNIYRGRQVDKQTFDNSMVKFFS
jgi:hypothetical protein